MFTLGDCPETRLLLMSLRSEVYRIILLKKRGNQNKDVFFDLHEDDFYSYGDICSSSRLYKCVSP